jgi:hypothetical protein
VTRLLLLPVTHPLLHRCLSLPLLRRLQLLSCLLLSFLLLLLLRLRCRQLLLAVRLAPEARLQSSSRQQQQRRPPQPPLQPPAARMLLLVRRVLGRDQRTSQQCT